MWAYPSLTPSFVGNFHAQQHWMLSQKVLFGNPQWKFNDSSLFRFRLSHPCDGKTDGRTDGIATAVRIAYAPLHAWHTSCQLSRVKTNACTCTALHCSLLFILFTQKSELMRRARAYGSFCSQVIVVYFYPFRSNSLLRSKKKSPKKQNQYF